MTTPEPEMPAATINPSDTDRPTMLDHQSRQWVAELRPSHPRHDKAVERLHTLLLRVSRHELGRRRAQLALAGPEFDDLAQQAAHDALLAILAKLDDFKGLSKFTTWAYKFVIGQISTKVAGHAWKYRPPGLDDDLRLEHLPEAIAPMPGEKVQQREQLQTLTAAISELTERQREVFVAIALNDVPLDIVALRLGSNRNAIYKNLFDARRRLRQQLAEAGHPVTA